MSVSVAGSARLFEGSDRTINEIMTLYFADRLKDGKSVERAAAMADKSSSGFGDRKPEDINMPIPVGWRGAGAGSWICFGTERARHRRATIFHELNIYFALA
jgi:hypothetical protein